MARHRSHSIEFKRQVAQEFIAGETLHALARRHDVSRNLILGYSSRASGVFLSKWTAMDGMRDRRPLSTAARSSRRQSGVAVCATGALTARRGAKAKIWTTLNNVSALP